MEFLTGFESTYMPGHDADVLGLTHHDTRWRDDLRLVRDSGIRRLRYPIPWHRIERTRGQYDWSWTDAVLAELRDLGLAPIVDPLHHTSYPRWLTEGFLTPDFPEVYAAFCAAVAARYPWVREYTVFNEPLPTTLLCTEIGVWPPARREPEAFWRMVVQVARAICLSTEVIRGARPDARFIHVDTAEGHGALDEESEGFVRYLNQRRFLFHDLVLGRLDTTHPLWPHLRDEGGLITEDLAWFRAHAARIDVLGLDYYAHCEHQFHVQGSTCPSRAPQGFAALARQYHARYGLPIMLTETNIRGYISDRISWLKYMVGECEALVADGLPFEGFTWFPFIDSTDWDTLLNVPRGNVDPVGLYRLHGPELERHGSELTRLYRGLAHGELTAADLPAYRLVAPVSEHLAGWQPHWEGWSWREPELVELPDWAWAVARMGADMRFAAG
ncbi:MAG TPA: family 1 glycosylhydrolase [Thermomicrobiales bacterium]|jgi:beta-glucosidase/6-phospho-beta-glucosidase/beta-galactosidase